MHLDQHFFRSSIKEVTFVGSSKLPAKFEFNVDSRAIKPGDIFVAIKGNKVDGHDYIDQAINNGAAGLIISNKKKDVLNKINKEKLDNLFIAIVDDPATALINLAKAWRNHITCPIVGITGSIGKTSTKEILSNILTSSSTKFISSYGNQNTALGISLNILKLSKEHEVGIFEMGISRRGEMSLLADIVKPTLAVITAIGHSHMEGLGSINDIANEKRAIFKNFTEANVGVINGDQSILANIAYRHPIVKFGFKTTNQIQARKVRLKNFEANFILKLYKNLFNINVKTNHQGLINNTLAAASVAYLLNIPSESIVKGIETKLNVKGRFERKNLKSGKGLLINDCCNASPESMKSALLAFEKFETKSQKLLVLGDMLELGVNSSFWHRQLGRFLRKVPSVNHVILVGTNIKHVKETLPVGLSFDHVLNWQEALDTLNKKLDKESTVLVKGSLGMQLTNLVTELT